MAALVSVVLVGLLAAPAAAVPTNAAKAGSTELDCEGGSPSAVLFLENSSAVAWGLDGDDLDGTQYTAKQLEFRVYQGDLDAEPAGDPLFVDSQSWGKRTGLDDIACTFVQHFEDDGDFTLFGDVVLAQVK